MRQERGPRGQQQHISRHAQALCAYNIEARGEGASRGSSSERPTAGINALPHVSGGYPRARSARSPSLPPATPALPLSAPLLRAREPPTPPPVLRRREAIQRHQLARLALAMYLSILLRCYTYLPLCRCFSVFFERPADEYWWTCCVRAAADADTMIADSCRQKSRAFNAFATVSREVGIRREHIVTWQLRLMEC